MDSSDQQAAYEAIVADGICADEVRDVAHATKASEPGAALRLAAALAHVAFAAPDRIADTYDAAARGWRGQPVDAAPFPPDGAPPEPISAAFWSSFRTLVADAAPGLSAGEITTRTASMSALLSSGFEARAAAACRRYTGVTEAAQAGFPPRTQLDTLRAAPENSLGHTLYRMIVDNGYDLEVLDRDTLLLSRLTPPLDFLNARILQAHDMWHIVAGYELTKLHEVGISAFQMAQFGHNYSAMFLAVVAATTSLHTPAAIPLLLETMLSAWAHGRATPPMMRIVWEQEWHQTTEAIRAAHGVLPYVSPYPAGIIEMFEAAA